MMAGNDEGDGRLKEVYLILLLVIGILATSIVYQAAAPSLSSSVGGSSRQEVLAVGDELVANFRIYNPAQGSRQYRYALYLNDELRYEDTVTVKSGGSTVFGGHYRALEPGEIKVTALVYESGSERIVKNITYFVTVKSQQS